LDKGEAWLIAKWLQNQKQQSQAEEDAGRRGSLSPAMQAYLAEESDLEYPMAGVMVSDYGTPEEEPHPAMDAYAADKMGFDHPWAATWAWNSWKDQSQQEQGQDGGLWGDWGRQPRTAAANNRGTISPVLSAYFANEAGVDHPWMAAWLTSRLQLDHEKEDAERWFNWQMPTKTYPDTEEVEAEEEVIIRDPNKRMKFSSLTGEITE
jgi:hypothetical protein